MVLDIYFLLGWKLFEEYSWTYKYSSTQQGFALLRTAISQMCIVDNLFPIIEGLRARVD